MGLGCGEAVEAQWMEHPCGNGDPVMISCENEEDVVWAEPSIDRCHMLAAMPGDVCENVGDECVLIQGFGCESMPDGPTANETKLFCRKEPFVDEPCPE